MFSRNADDTQGMAVPSLAGGDGQPSGAPHFFDPQAVLSMPVTTQQVLQFSPGPAQNPTIVLADGSRYYGDVNPYQNVPHGCGILLFRQENSSVSSNRGAGYVSGDRYGGSWVNGQFDGDGILITTTFTYHGEWRAGRMHGKGRMTYTKSYVDRMPDDPEGGGTLGALLLRGLSYLSPFEDSGLKPMEYIGEFSGPHYRHGKGMMRYHNGDVYEGDWYENRRHGTGRLLRADGEVYEGHWKRDEQHGYGVIRYVTGSYFKGSMVHNQRDGEGVMGFANGDEYYGHFHADVISGEGTMRYKNGDVYEGLWHDGMRHGEGKYTLLRKGATVRGTFVKGLIHGSGTVEFPNVSTFIGQFDRGERTHGTLFWHEGATEEHRGKLCYQGAWEGELMHGQGLLWYANGDFFFGRFAKGKRVGPGNVRYADGSEFSGQFAQDERHGWGLLQHTDGSIKAGRWQQDRFTEGYEGEWDGVAFHGVGRIRLSLEVFMGLPAKSSAISSPAQTSLHSVDSGEATTRVEEAPVVEFLGIFVNGQRDGLGVMTLPAVVGPHALLVAGSSSYEDTSQRRSQKANTFLQKSHGYHVLKGRWEKNLLSCDKGVWAFPSGEVYVGGFVEGVRHSAVGRLWLPDGSVFAGAWARDAPDGTGIFFAKNTKSPIYCVATPLSTSAPTVATGDSTSSKKTVRTRGGVSIKGLDFLFGLFGSAKQAVPTESESDESGKVVERYSDHYVIAGTWSSHRVTYNFVQGTIAPQKTVCPLTEEMRASSSVTTAVHGSVMNAGTAIKVPAGFPIKPPATSVVGMKCGTGEVFFPSGVCLRSEWMDNVPCLAVPYRPHSLFDVYVQELIEHVCLPSTFRTPSQTSLLTVKFSSLENTAYQCTSGLLPLLHSSRPPTEKSPSTSCTFCNRECTFYRRPTQCTLCWRTSCASCLRTAEKIGVSGMAPLLVHSQFLLQQLLKGEKINETSSSLYGDTPYGAPMSEVSSLPVCEDCIRMVQLEVRLQTLWIPTRMFASVFREQHLLSDELLAIPKYQGTPSRSVCSASDEVTDGLSGETHLAMAAEQVEPFLHSAYRTVLSQQVTPIHGQALSNAVADAGSRREPATLPPTPIPPHKLEGSPCASHDSFVTYSGYTSRSIPHLVGSMWWGRRHFYWGGFFHGNRHGYGVQIMPNGERYIGEFQNNEWHGVGSYFTDDGAVLQGIFKSGRLITLRFHGEVDGQLQPHGLGISYEADGFMYNGEWVHGRRHGTGILQYPDGSMYSGSFVDGSVEGEGKLVTEDSTYYGEFVGGEKCGHGLELLGSCVVKGTWKRNMLNGFCRIYDNCLNEIYETTYINGNERDDCFMVPLSVSDEEASHCSQCGTSFSVFLRRHHCRLCGGVACANCTKRRVVLPSHFKLDGPQRVCDVCLCRLEQRRMLAIKRYADGTVYAGCWSQGKWVSRGLYCRTDGIFIVLSASGKPILPGEVNSTAKTDAPTTLNGQLSLSPSILRDAAPSRAVLDAFPHSSTKAELDSFLLWWATMVTECKVVVPLDIPLIDRYHHLPVRLLPQMSSFVSEGSAEAEALATCVGDSSAADSLHALRWSRPPPMKYVKLFLTLEQVRLARTEKSSTNAQATDLPATKDGEAEFGDVPSDNEEAAVVRAARFAPAVIPQAPDFSHVPLSRGDERNKSTSRFPHTYSPQTMTLESPRLAEHDISDDSIILAIHDERKERFLHDLPHPKFSRDEEEPLHAGDAPATDTTSFIPCRHYQPLFPRPPPLPTPEANQQIPWENWTTKEVPLFDAGIDSSNNKSPSLSPEFAFLFASPWWRPDVPDVQQLLESGKMAKAAELMARYDGEASCGTRSHRNMEVCSTTKSGDEDGHEDNMEDFIVRAWQSALSQSEYEATLPALRGPVLNERMQRYHHLAQACRTKPKRAHVKSEMAAFTSGWVPSPLHGPYRFEIEPARTSSDSFRTNRVTVKQVPI